MSFRFKTGKVLPPGGALYYEARFGSGEDRGALVFMAEAPTGSSDLGVTTVGKGRTLGNGTFYPVTVSNFGSSSGVDLIGGGLT
jgi:hypothetical protein